MKIHNLTITVCALAAPTLCCAATAANDALKRQLVEKYDAAPILFVENRGQAPKGVDFVSSGLGRKILTRKSGVELYLPGREPDTAQKISIDFDRTNKLLMERPSARRTPEAAL